MADQLHHNPPFRAEHLGSLKRPEQLLRKREAVAKKQASPDELKPVEDEAIKEIVDEQLKLGYRAITDGEYRRHMFWGTFFPSLHGMREIYNPPASLFRPYMPDVAAFLEEHHVPGETVVCVGKISHNGQSTYISQFEFLKTLLPQDRWKDIKLTLAAPNWYHMRYKEGKAYPKEVYGSDEEYFGDIAVAYRVELGILYERGLRNVQIDDPNLAYFCSEKMIEGWKQDPLNHGTVDDLFDTYIPAYNDCLSERPPDMHVGLHLCRGNFVNSRHFSEGGYDRIARKLFNDLNVDTYYLEYDTPRAGGFVPLASLPKHKSVILGVVTSKFPEMEDKEEMKRRICVAADIVAQGGSGDVDGDGEKEEGRQEALKRMGVSPQCGFASHEEGNLVSIEDMKRKLKLVRDIADEVWPGEP